MKAEIGCWLLVFISLRPIFAQPLTCSACSDLYEEAAARQRMIDARQALLEAMTWAPTFGSA